jgi:hypothetical protein
VHERAGSPPWKTGHSETGLGESTPLAPLLMGCLGDLHLQNSNTLVCQYVIQYTNKHSINTLHTAVKVHIFNDLFAYFSYTNGRFPCT